MLKLFWPRQRAKPSEPAPSGTLFQGFWHGPSMGPLREACVASFIRKGHRFDLYCYAPVAVPEGVRLRDANEVIPFSEVFYFDNPISGKPDIGPFSDLFRFKLLSMRGGWWSDVDAFCLADSIPNVPRAWAQELPEHRPDAVGTSQIAFTSEDPLIHEIHERCLAMTRSRLTHREAIGPDLLAKVIEEKKLPMNMFGNPDLFYPVRWIEMFKLWLPQFRSEMERRLAGAIFLPVYASFPQYIGLQLGSLPPEGSYLADLMRENQRYPADAHRYSAEEIAAATREFVCRHRQWAYPELWRVSGSEALRRLGLGRSLADLARSAEPIH